MPRKKTEDEEMGIEGAEPDDDSLPCLKCEGDGCPECDDFDDWEEEEENNDFEDELE